MYRLVFFRSKGQMSGSLNYRILVVHGKKVVQTLGNYYYRSTGGTKYLYLNKALLRVWLARGVHISERKWLLLSKFV